MFCEYNSSWGVVLLALSVEEELEYIALMEEELHYRDGRKLWTYFPDEGPLRRELYPKQLEFFRAGKSYPMRLFSKANRVGGTEGFGCEFTYHLTGDYPEWWEGHVFGFPITAWAAGTTNLKTKEILQAKLFGTKDAAQTNKIGTGIIPRDAIEHVRLRAGLPGAIESATILHKDGGSSELTLKSFEQGHEAFQGNEVHVIWADELMPLPVLTECVVRITPTATFAGGLIAWTVTPEEGLTEAIMEFMPDGQFPEEPIYPHYVVNATWDDVPHLSEEAKAVLRAGIPPYQLDARSRGIPALGAGVIYPVPEDDYLVDPFEIPPYFRRAYGMDVGWKRTAAVWGAYDADNGIWYLYAEHYRGQAEPPIHAAAIRERGEWVPGVLDPAARGRGQRDGQSLLSNYLDLGLSLSKANPAVTAGLDTVWMLLSTGRLKIFRGILANWLREVRVYRRDEKGAVIKENDHLMDATRYLIMSGGDVATPVPIAARDEDSDWLTDRVGLGTKDARLGWLR